MPTLRSPCPRVVVVAALVAVLAATPPPAHGQGTGAAVLAYAWPVPGPPVRAFDAPPGPYGPGHRGVDLPVEPAQPVHPMAGGHVTFAGPVAGDGWVTVRHGDGVTTTYGPLRVGRHLRPGRVVRSSDVLGEAAGNAHGHAGWLHVGARRFGRYVDPAELVGSAPPPMAATLVGAGPVTAGEVAWPRGHLPLVPGTPPSPNHLFVLAGLSSRTGARPFDLGDLGYRDGTWTQYTYLGLDASGRPIPYDYEATWQHVHESALALREQLRAFAAEHPGQAVDLVGHSLGGLVGMYYLLVLHDATDPTLPPIGRIATVASPLQGTESADAGRMATSNRVGRMLTELAIAQLGLQMRVDTPVFDDLQTDSPVIAAVADAWQRYREDPYSSPLATGTDVLTIGSVTDLAVNEHRSDLPGATHETVVDDVLDDPTDAHSTATRDPRTEQLLLAFLSGEPLPAGGTDALLAGVLVHHGAAVAIAVGELLVGAGVKGVGAIGSVF